MKKVDLWNLNKGDIIFVGQGDAYFLGILRFKDHVQMIGVQFLMGFEEDFGPIFNPFSSRNNYSDGLMMLEKIAYYEHLYIVEKTDLDWIFRSGKLTKLKITK